MRKKFGDERFDYWESFFDKGDAQKEAERLKDEGTALATRVVPEGGRWAIYYKSALLYE